MERIEQIWNMVPDDRVDLEYGLEIEWAGDDDIQDVSGDKQKPERKKGRKGERKKERERGREEGRKKSIEQLGDSSLR